MVFAFFDAPVDLAELARAHPTGPDGLSLADLSRIARDHGFNAEGYRVELDKLADVTTPVILHWRPNHYVCFSRMTGDDLAVHDPVWTVDGRCIERIYPRESAQARYGGVLLAVEPMTPPANGQAAPA